ncbi:MAG: sigma-54 dependent transcriptional regulator [Syntrophaceae bacterium]
MDAPRVLIADDEEYVRAFFKGILTPEGYALTFAHDGRQALESWSQHDFDLIIMDIRMPHFTGLEILEKIRTQDHHTMIIMISAISDIDAVIEAMRLGANDFFAKPFTSIDKIKIDIRNCLERAHLLRENEDLKSQVDLKDAHKHLVYASKAMEDVIETAGRAAHFDSPVLIQGESGTGKELVARFIHQASSRKNKPFLAINCGAIPETLLEPTLFGYEKGAFTGAHRTTTGYFEAVAGGTVFLDEISETSPSFQIKLLRVLQEGEVMRVGGHKVTKVDFRLISATNKNVQALVRSGAFRKDLFYRIHVVGIEIPPLRHRIEDIPLLIQHFMGRLIRKNKLKPRQFSPALIDYLTRLPWEGNVRELENLVERLLVVSSSKVIGLENLPPELQNHAAASTSVPSLAYEEAKESFERTFLEKLLARTKGDLKEAARISGLDLSSLYRKKNRYRA